jgi:glycosyltransferase involved in cell wall biosynthesis
MATGRPVVASDVGQIGEILRHGETGLLVPPADPPALARALAALRADPALRASLGQAARREARARHSWDARLETILAVDGEPIAAAGDADSEEACRLSA